MSRLNHSLDAIFALVHIAARPLRSYAAFLVLDHRLLRLLRVYALDREVRQGSIYQRWLMDLAFGYENPIVDHSVLGRVQLSR